MEGDDLGRSGDAGRYPRPGSDDHGAHRTRQEELRPIMQARRIVLIASLLAAGFALSGCESFDPESWFNPKKPLPGERKAMFPGGVPGVPQGVPEELRKGYQPAPDMRPEPANQEAPKPRFVQPERKPAPKPKQAAAPRQPPRRAQAQEQSRPPQAAPWPSQQSSQSNSPFPPPPGR